MAKIEAVKNYSESTARGIFEEARRLFNLKGWMAVYDNDGIRVEYQWLENSPAPLIRMEIATKASPAAVWKVMGDTTQAPKYDPTATGEALMLDKKGNSALLLTSTRMGGLFKMRDLLLHQSLDRKNNFFAERSVIHESHPPRAGFLRAEQGMWAVKLEKKKICILMHDDLKGVFSFSLAWRLAIRQMVGVCRNIRGAVEAG